MDNPADKLKDSMWGFLKTKGQEGSVKALKKSVYALIGMTTQKDAGQRGKSSNMPFASLDLIKWAIICEAVALVLSGKLDDIEREEVEK